MTTEISRRNFLKASLGTAAALSFLPLEPKAPTATASAGKAADIPLPAAVSLKDVPKNPISMAQNAPLIK